MEPARWDLPRQRTQVYSSIDFSTIPSAYVGIRCVVIVRSHVRCTEPILSRQCMPMYANVMFHGFAMSRRLGDSVVLLAGCWMALCLN